MPSGRVIVASDHGGYKLKEALKRHLRAGGLQVEDMGTQSTDSVDYPVFARAAAEALVDGRAPVAIVIDGAGIGSAMAANKIPGVRAGMAFNEATAINAREHNGANLLTLGAGYLTEAQACRIVDAFLSTECTVDRHLRRVGLIDALDAGRSLPAPYAQPPGSQAMPSDYELLVDRISRILQSNPTLIGQAGGAPAVTGAKVSREGGNYVVCTTTGECVTLGPDLIAQIQGLSPGARMSGSLGQVDLLKGVAGLIDHTLLKPQTTYQQIDQLCAEAIEWGFASVCVNSFHVKRCASILRGAKPKVCTVIGFPLGAVATQIKALEARQAIRDGARELDMVINIGALKSGDSRFVYEDIRRVREVARDRGVLLKVIIETALLTDQEKIEASILSKEARADFVKTSTGFASGGATVHDVALMSRAVEAKLGVKASGGVKSAADARAMVEAGASRIGASVGVKIASEAASSR